MENERAESLLAGPRRRERDRNGAREREKNQSREKRERQTGEKEKEASAARPGKRERGEKRGEKGQGEDGQEDEGGTKYRRRTAVGIKRGDGRRCGGPTLFPVEDWTAAAPLRRPSCPPTSSFLPSSCSFFFSSSSSSSPFRASACACARDRVVCVHVPRVLLYRPTLYLTSSPTRVPRAHASGSGSGSGERCPVRSLRRMTRRRATRRDHAQCSIGLSWPDLCAKAAPQWARRTHVTPLQNARS